MGRSAMLILASMIAIGFGQPAFAQVQPVDDGVFERAVVEVGPAIDRRLERISVDNPLGDVRVEGHDGDSIVINAFKRAADDATLDRLKVSLVHEPDGPVRIRTSFATVSELRPVPAGSVRIDLVIRAPRGAAVKAQVWNGTLAIEGMENGANLSSNRGDIQVRKSTGEFVSQTARGKQRFAEIFGAIDAQGMLGDVHLETIRGSRLAAIVHRGHVRGRDIRVQQVTARATRGNIDLEGQAIVGGSYTVASHQGDVVVRLTRSDMPVSIVARAGSGTVSLPAGLRSVEDGSGVFRASSGSDGNSRHAPTALELRTERGNIQFSWIN